MRYYSLIDEIRPDAADPHSLVRSPDGGPPYELFDPETGGWSEEPELAAWFLGDELGLAELPEGAWAEVADRLQARK